MSKFRLKDNNGNYIPMASVEDVPTKISELENDSGFITPEGVIKYQPLAPTDGTAIWIDTKVGLAVGGSIFYDDGDNGATYTFYDN